MFSNRAISITAPRLWNDLPPELRTISSPPPPSLLIARHHLHLPPLSVSPRAFHSKLKSHLFNLSYPDTLTLLIIPPPHLNNTHPNSYSVPFWYSGNRT